MKMHKKVECRDCKSISDNYEVKHPANWTYYLCGQCLKKDKASEEQSPPLPEVKMFTGILRNV